MTERLRISFTSRSGQPMTLRLLADYATPASWTHSVPILCDAEYGGLTLRMGERSDPLVPGLRTTTVDVNLAPKALGSDGYAAIRDLMEEIIDAQPGQWRFELYSGGGDLLHRGPVFRGIVLPDSIRLPASGPVRSVELVVQDFPDYLLERPHTIAFGTRVKVADVIRGFLQAAGYDGTFELISDWSSSESAFTDLLSVEFDSRALWTTAAEESIGLSGGGSRNYGPRWIGRTPDRTGIVRGARYRGTQEALPLRWVDAIESVLSIFNLTLRQDGRGVFMLFEPGTLLRASRKTAPIVTARVYKADGTTSTYFYPSTVNLSGRDEAESPSRLEAVAPVMQASLEYAFNAETLYFDEEELRKWRYNRDLFRFEPAIWEYQGDWNALSWRDDTYLPTLKAVSSNPAQNALVRRIGGVRKGTTRFRLELDMALSASPKVLSLPSNPPDGSKFFVFVRVTDGTDTYYLYRNGDSLGWTQSATPVLIEEDFYRYRIYGSMAFELGSESDSFPIDGVLEVGITSPRSTGTSLYGHIQRFRMALGDLSGAELHVWKGADGGDRVVLRSLIGQGPTDDVPGALLLPDGSLATGWVVGGVSRETDVLQSLVPLEIVRHRYGPRRRRSIGIRSSLAEFRSLSRSLFEVGDGYRYFPLQIVYDAARDLVELEGIELNDSADTFEPGTYVATVGASSGGSGFTEAFINLYRHAETDVRERALVTTTSDVADGVQVTSLQITAVPKDGLFQAGDRVLVVDVRTLRSDYVTVSQGVAAGATTLPIEPKTFGFPLHSGSYVVATSQQISDALFIARNQIIFRIANQQGGDDLVSQINLASDGVRIEGKYIKLTAESIIADGIIKAEHIDVGDLFAQNITVNTGGVLQSENFVPGSSGWQITSAGNAEFNNVTIRGALIEGGTISSGSHLVPDADNRYDLGSSTARWRNLYLSQGAYIGGHQVWHAGNDGAGSGLDADLLDGYDASAFPRKAENATITGSWTFNTTTKIGGSLSVGTTASPAYKLDVAGSGRFSGGLYADTVLLRSDGSTGKPALTWESDTNTGIYHPSDDTLGLVTGGAERLRISSGGYVGIRTVPSYPFDVSGQSRFNDDVIFNKTISSSSFGTGFFGDGWRITSLGEATFESLTVRGTLRVYELLLEQLRATKGNVVVSDAARLKVQSVSGSTVTLAAVETDSDRYIPFAVGDLVLAQRFQWNASSKSYNVILRVKGTVTSVNNSTKPYTCTITLTSDSTVPSVNAEYDFVRVGSSDSARQGVIYLAASDQGAPFMDVIDGIASWSDWNNTQKIKLRLGKLSGIIDNDFGGTLSGYGLYANNVYLKGKLIITGGSGISNLTDAGKLATKDTVNLDVDVVDGSTYKRTTANEKTGASRAYTALDGSAHLVTAVKPGARIGTPPGAGLYMDSQYMGYYSGGAWKVFIQNNGQFRFEGNSAQYIAWDGSNLVVQGTVKQASNKWALNNDGSGQLASSRISWDENGTMTIGSWVVEAQRIRDAANRLELDLDDGFPQIKVASSNVNTNSSNYVRMYWTSGAWGLQGVSGSSTVFELGSTNRIAGWSFSSAQLSSTNISLISGSNARIEIGATSPFIAGIAAGSSSSDVVFWAGNSYSSRNTAPFRVTLGGSLTATSGTIGGWTIGSSKLYNGTSIVLDSSNRRITINGDAAYNSMSNGIFLGMDSGVPKFRLKSRLMFDGDQLIVQGNIAAEKLTLSGGLDLGNQTIAANAGDFYRVYADLGKIVLGGGLPSLSSAVQNYTLTVIDGRFTATSSPVQIPSAVQTLSISASTYDRISFSIYFYATDPTFIGGGWLRVEFLNSAGTVLDTKIILPSSSQTERFFEYSLPSGTTRVRFTREGGWVYPIEDARTGIAATNIYHLSSAFSAVQDITVTARRGMEPEKHNITWDGFSITDQFGVSKVRLTGGPWEDRGWNSAGGESTPASLNITGGLTLSEMWRFVMEDFNLTTARQQRRNRAFVQIALVNDGGTYKLIARMINPANVNNTITERTIATF